MKYDTLFLTRTLKEDYRWFCRPSYVDQNLDTFLRPLFFMVENQKNASFFRKDGRINLFFWVNKQYCVLCYLYFTGRKDVAGRQIYALEGICCPKEERFHMWKNLPFIIINLWDKGLGEYIKDKRYMYDPTVFPKQVIIDNNPLAYGDCSEILAYFNNTDNSMQNMIEEIYSARKMYTFIFGTKDRDFYLVKTDRVYKYNEERKKYSVNTAEDYLKFWGTEHCKVQLFFGNNRSDYQMSVLAVTEKKELVIGYEDLLEFGKEGISIATLVNIQNLIESKLNIYGFKTQNYRPVIEEKKISYFYKKSELLNNVSMHYITAEMNDMDGAAEFFVADEDKMIRSLFQYSRRISKEYYGKNDGRETIYLLNTESGIWIIYFEKNDTIYCLKGFYIERKDRSAAWANLHIILEKYFLKRNIYSTEFEQAVQQFEETRSEQLRPDSCIITSLPDGNFPNSADLKVYTVAGNKKLAVGKLKRPPRYISNISEKCMKNYFLIPPQGLLKKNWYLQYYTVQKREVISHQFIAKSIVDGVCDMKEFLEEFENVKHYIWKKYNK